MGDDTTGPDEFEIYSATLSSIHERTGWEPVDPSQTCDLTSMGEVRFRHPRFDGVLLVQAPDSVDTAPVRALLYQSLVNGPANGTRFLEALRWRYRTIIETYGTPSVDVPTEPPTVAVATIEADRTLVECRRVVRELECIALDVAHLHDRLYRIITTSEAGY